MMKEMLETEWGVQKNRCHYCPDKPSQLSW